MQIARRRRGVTMLSALLVALFAVGNAYADTRAITDGNDRPGPLDIRSASHAHAGARVVHRITTFSTWRLGVIGRNTSNLLAVEISTDGDPALERVVLVFSANGRLVAPVIRLPAGTVVGNASASRPNGRSVRVSIRRSLLGNPTGYRWNAHSQYRAAGACSRFCTDRAPNAAGRVLHDITAPAITLTSFPTIPLDVEYDVSFSISDKGGAGLRSWQLQHRPFGTSSWTTVASGTSGGLKTHHHVSAQDNDDQFRVTAVDRRGNSTVRTRLVSVPVDDNALTYTLTWATGGTPADFLGTLHSSSEAGAKAIYSFTGQYVAWVAPGGVGGADVWIDGQRVDTVDLSPYAGPRNVVFQRTLASAGSHTIEISVILGPLPVDGIIVR